jgi:ribosomal protein L21E
METMYKKGDKVNVRAGGSGKDGEPEPATTGVVLEDVQDQDEGVVVQLADGREEEVLFEALEKVTD